ncbi:MAG: amidohydrolase family protein [Chitinophagaceae bacterium]|nr:amidohydrolase family protein [Chitinophagaceae bacterium]
MILHDVIIYGSPERKHIYLEQGLIQTITSNRELLEGLEDPLRIELNGAVVMPGFINSHDHLDFNSFPRLGNRIYTNYTDWGNDIHAANGVMISAVKRIPQHLRIKWGLYKNLINGFTTVVNHGKKLEANPSLVNVFQDCYVLHSPAFERNWSLKLNHPLRNQKPFVMHIGEGTDSAAGNEIDKVIKANLFKRKIVAVHGVAMSAQQASSFAGIVWCPASNYFLLGKTAPVKQLKNSIKIVFGTDSTLTGSWDTGNHFAAAIDSDLVSEHELYHMLTDMPAALWGLKDRGMIKEGTRADLLIKEAGSSIYNNHTKEILLVLNNGEIRMAAESILTLLPVDEKKVFDRIRMDTKTFYVKAGIHQLITEILSFFPQADIPFLCV